MGERGGDGPVYTSQHGAMCPECGQPAARCRCAAERYSQPGGAVRVSRETAGRKGKGNGVTVVRGAPVSGAELKQLAKQLKGLCGSGGTVKDGLIEIQGDHRDKIVAALEKRGWTVKRSGG